MLSVTLDYLYRCNQTLSALDDEFTASFKVPQHIIIIVALPRAGSAFLQQILISDLEIGYVSNLMAKFWMAPTIGARLQTEFRQPNFMSSFHSKYGNTDGPLEPHEWGWFWKEMLALKGDEHYINRPIDTARLCRKLAAVEHVIGSPLVFDSVYAVANLQRLLEILPDLRVIYLTRDPFFVCNSILNARIRRYGNMETFYGHPPSNIDEIRSIADPVEQVVAQVRTLIDEFEQTLQQVLPEHRLDVAYEQLRANPTSVIQDFVSFQENVGIVLNRRGTQLPVFEDRNASGLIHPEWAERLRICYTDYFEGKS